MAKESLRETARDIAPLLSENKSKIKWECRLVTAKGVFLQQNWLLWTLDVEHNRPWRPWKYHNPCSKHCFESDSRMSYRGKFVPQIALSSGWNNNHKDKIANLQLGTYWKEY